MTNVLVLSAGSRNLVIRYFREALAGNGKIVAADMDSLAPALTEADEQCIVPSIADPGYIEAVIEICRAHRINGVLSLIDPELCILAQNADKLASEGAMFIGSSAILCDLALDKLAMYRWLLSHGYQTARSYSSIEELDEAVSYGLESYPVFIKPSRGSASLGIGMAKDRETAAFLLAHGKRMMAQQVLHGPEYGVDVYVDMLSGEVASLFAKRKLRMRAGETDRAISFKDDALFDLMKRFVIDVGFRGPIDIDVFDIDGEWYISEVNPRFGGGYPHAHACGCGFPALVLENLHGRKNSPHIGGYEEDVYMSKYSETMISYAMSRGGGVSRIPIGPANP